MTGTAPDYLMELCQLSSSIPCRRNLRSVERGDILTPCFHTEYGRHMFSVAGPQLWNSLPPHLDDKEQKKTAEDILIPNIHQRF